MDTAQRTGLYLLIIGILVTSLFYAVYPLLNQPTTTTSPSHASIQVPYFSNQYIQLPIILPALRLTPESPPNIETQLTSQTIPVHNPQLYLVQFKPNQVPPITPLAYFDTQTYVLNLSPQQLSQLITEQRVNYLDYYHPYYKLDTSLTKEEATFDQIIATFLPHLTADQISKQILTISPNIEFTVKTQPGSATATIVVTDYNQIIQLARLPQVISLSPQF